MVKHNNIVPNAHFHKDWQRRVKCFFDQPAKKKVCVIATSPRRPLQMSACPPNLPLLTLS